MKLTDFCSLKFWMVQEMCEEKLCLLLFVDALVVVAHKFVNRLLTKVNFQVRKCEIEM